MARGRERRCLQLLQSCEQLLQDLHVLLLLLLLRLWQPLLLLLLVGEAAAQQALWHTVNPLSSQHCCFDCCEVNSTTPS
jgi:hypothetical protein